MNKYVLPLDEGVIQRKFTRLHKMLSGMFILVIDNIFIFTVQLKVDERFTYIFPEDNDDSPMNHTSLIYQINYLNSGHYADIFQDPTITQAVHSKEIHWNFKNYDDPKYGNALVMPSNVFEKNGKTSKRVWAKNNKKYFSKAIKNSLEDFEQVVDSTTPFIDFTAYQEAAEKAESGTLTTAEEKKFSKKL